MFCLNFCNVEKLCRKLYFYEIWRYHGWSPKELSFNFNILLILHSVTELNIYVNEFTVS